MGALLKLSHAVDRLSAGFGWLATVFVLLAVLISAANATVRYLFSYSSNGFLEIQWYLFGALFMLGAAHTLRLNQHVRVDILYGMFSARTKLWVDALGFALLFLPVTVTLLVLTSRFFWLSFLQNEASGNAGGLVLWPAKLMLPLGFFLLTLQGVSELIKRLGALAGDVAVDTRYEKPLQ